MPYGTKQGGALNLLVLFRYTKEAGSFLIPSNHILASLSNIGFIIAPSENLSFRTTLLLNVR